MHRLPFFCPHAAYRTSEHFKAASQRGRPVFWACSFAGSTPMVSILTDSANCEALLLRKQATPHAPFFCGAALSPHCEYVQHGPVMALSLQLAGVLRNFWEVLGTPYGSFPSPRTSKVKMGASDTRSHNWMSPFWASPLFRDVKGECPAFCRVSPILRQTQPILPFAQDPGQRRKYVQQS